MLFPGALGLGLTYMSERKAVLGLAVSQPLPHPHAPIATWPHPASCLTGHCYPHLSEGEG